MFPYAFWLRYLDIFAQVNIVARVSLIQTANQTWQRVDGPNVEFVALPSYIGPWGFALSLPKLHAKLRARKGVNRAVIYRVPGILAALYQAIAMPVSKPYGAEVVGDPADVFAKDANSSLLRPVFKALFTTLLKKQCREAVSIAYVTEHKLQHRYPPAANAIQTHYSSIQLLDADFNEPHARQLGDVLNIVCIGNLAQPYKGCDFMLCGIAELVKLGVQVHLRWIGGGALLEKMQHLAVALSIDKHVTFVGNLATREAIRGELDRADLFVLSSRQEGLPRVLIEAMARALVCIATDVGGVDELLPEDFILQRDNLVQLVERITTVNAMTLVQRQAQSKRNFLVAQRYHDKKLQVRRQLMYRGVLAAQPL